jgi:hypothetical protein
MSKVIYSSLFTGNNEKAPVKTYIITSRKLKNKIKAGINFEKLLKIIMNTQMKGVTVKNLMANCPHIYKTFFGRATSENRKKKKDSIIVNTMRTSVNVKIVFFRKNLITFRISLRIIVTLNDSVEFRGLINLDAEINCIDKVTYK